MTHQPQQILVRVDCKERLPKEEIKIGKHCYKPATRIVLTVEDYDSEMRTAYLDGYNAANGRIS